MSGPPDVLPTEGAVPEPAPIPGRLLLARLRPLWPWLVLAALIVLGWRELREIDLYRVRLQLRATPVDLIATLLAATMLNLAVAGLYDVLALGERSLAPRFGARWTAGLVSFAWSNFLTVGPLAGPALRLWMYRRLGVQPERARAALMTIMAAFALGLLALCGASELPLPGQIDSTPTRLALAVPLGVASAFLLRRLRRLRLFGGDVGSRGGRSGALIGVAMLDWLLAWFVFHLAVGDPGGNLHTGRTLAAFFVGQLVGLASFVPGGLGSADAWWMVSLGGAAPDRDQLVAALLLYRLVYYVLPWFLATLFLAGQLVRGGRRAAAFVRSAVATYTFLCGLVLLASAALPALADRAAFLQRSVPLPVVEISHGASIVLGFLMLVMSRGLARGYRSSHRLALALFTAGGLTTLLKGLDFEEAILSFSAAAMLLVFRWPFTRNGRLNPPLEFVVSVSLVAVMVFGAAGLSALPAPPRASAVLSEFDHLAHGPRFFRGLLLLAGFATVVGLHFAQRTRAEDTLPSSAAIDAALGEARHWSESTNALLIAAGDKAIFRPRPDAPGGGLRGWLAYRTAGRFLVAFSDPVCPPGSERGVLAAFLEQARELDRDVVLYQITTALLPAAHDLGFSFFKLGEEGIVDLTRFDLKGNKAKTWRHAINRVEREGGVFNVLAGDELRPLLPELREVSDEWLGDRHMEELRFSIGRFEERYLMRFPCAVLRDGSGRVAAFANILEGRPGEEISVDLMRYRTGRDGGREGSLGGVMDYLFIRIMLHGKERGFRRFSLGMAPLAAVGEERWARPIEKLARFFSRHGERWYGYEGLRRYKEKFDPDWVPRYMAYQRPWDWPLAVTTTAALIAGGWRALLFPKGERG